MVINFDNCSCSDITAFDTFICCQGHGSHTTFSIIILNDYEEDVLDEEDDLEDEDDQDEGDDLDEEGDLEDEDDLDEGDDLDEEGDLEDEDDQVNVGHVVDALDVDDVVDLDALDQGEDNVSTLLEAKQTHCFKESASKKFY